MKWEILASNIANFIYFHKFFRDQLNNNEMIYMIIQSLNFLFENFLGKSKQTFKFSSQEGIIFHPIKFSAETSKWNESF